MFNKLLYLLFLLMVWASLLTPKFSPAKPSETKEPAVSFSKQIAPILVSKCLGCHNPKKEEGSYRLDSFELAKKLGDNESVQFTPGKPENSQWYQLIISDDVDERMPKDADALSKQEVQLIKRWITQGAKFDGKNQKASLSSIIPIKPHPAAPKKYLSPIPITAVAISPEGTEIFVGGYNEVTVWDSSNGKLKRRIGNLPQRIYSIHFHPENKYVAIAGGYPAQRGEALLVDPKSGKIVRLLYRSGDVILDVKFSPDGKQVATAAADRSVRIFQTKTGKLLHKIENHADWVMAVSWSSNGKYLATASRDKTAKVVSVETGKLVATYNDHTKTVFAVAFHSNNQMVYSAGKNRKIHLWNLKDSKKQKDIQGFSGDVFKMSRIGKYLVSCSADKTVRLHDANNLKLIRNFTGHQDFIFCVDLNPKKKLITAGCFDGKIRVWNMDNAKLITEFFAAPGYQ